MPTQRLLRGSDPGPRRSLPPPQQASAPGESAWWTEDRGLSVPVCSLPGGREADRPLRGPGVGEVSAGIPQPLAVSLYPLPTAGCFPHLLPPPRPPCRLTVYAVWSPPNTPSFLRALILPGPQRGSPGPPPSPLSDPCPPVTHPHFLPHLVLKNPTDPGVPFYKQVLCPLKLGMGMHGDTGRPWPREAGTSKGAGLRAACNPPRVLTDSFLPLILPLRPHPSWPHL